MIDSTNRTNEQVHASIRANVEAMSERERARFVARLKPAKRVLLQRIMATQPTAAAHEDAELAAEMDRRMNMQSYAPGVVRGPHELRAGVFGALQSSAATPGAAPGGTLPSVPQPTTAPTRGAQVDELRAIEARLGLSTRRGGVQRVGNALIVSAIEDERA